MSCDIVFVGFSKAPTPFHDGTLVPSPDLVIGPLVPDALGAAKVQGHWPSGVPTGTTVTAQAWVAVPVFLSKDYAATTAVRITAQ